MVDVEFFASKDEEGLLFESNTDLVKEIHEKMEKRDLVGSDYLGWLHYPSHLSEDELGEIQDYGNFLDNNNRKIFCLGIGGSYLGAKASISALVGTKSKVEFYGNNFSALDLEEGLEDYKPSQDHLIIISKSGTTMETAVAFRLFRAKALRELGTRAYKSFTAITDGKKGALFDFATKHSIKKYVVPEDMGGRYSVLSPVGLLPMAAAGIDIKELIKGAKQMEKALMDPNLRDNPAYQYGLLRQSLYKRGKIIEVFAAYEPRLFEITNWYKQLFGESEGKEGGGIMPINLLYSTDLHSIGQYVQEGARNLFETILWIDQSHSSLSLADSDSEDGLEDYTGLKIDLMNKSAMEGTRRAHVEGGVPNIGLRIPRLDPESIGGLFYFLEKACAMSAYIQGVNPFDQPGVEDYKREMKISLRDR